jgi:hypothetical protein
LMELLDRRGLVVEGVLAGLGVVYPDHARTSRGATSTVWQPEDRLKSAFFLPPHSKAV